MTSDQGYETVFRFLVGFWMEHKKEFDDDLPILLSFMDKTIWTDGKPGDPAYTKIWQECSNYQTEMTTEDTFQALINILKEYISLGQGVERDIERVLAEIQSDGKKYHDVFDEIVKDVIG